MKGKETHNFGCIKRRSFHKRAIYLYLYVGAALIIHLVILYILGQISQHPQRITITHRVNLTQLEPSVITGLDKGSLYLQQGNLDSALDSYLRVLAEDPSNLFALNRAGWTMVLYGKPEEAIEYFDKVLEKHPKDRYTLMMRAGANIVKKDFEEAVADYKRAESISPDNSNIQYGLGRLYLLKQDFISAEKYFTKALEIEPENPYYRLSRSFSRINQRKLKEAEQDAKMVRALFPLNPDTEIGTYLALAEIHELTDRHEEAREYYKKVKEIQRLQKDKPPKGETNTGFDRVFDLGFDHWENPRLGKAVTYKDSGEYKKALVELDKLLEDPINPKTIAYLYKAYIFYQLGDPQKAAENAKLWFEGPMEDTEHFHAHELAALESLGYMYMEDYDNALRRVNFALQFNNEYFYHRGLIYFKQGRYEEALTDLTKYIKDFDHLEEWKHACKLVEIIKGKTH